MRFPVGRGLTSFRGCSLVSSEKEVAKNGLGGNARASERANEWTDGRTRRGNCEVKGRDLSLAATYFLFINRESAVPAFAKARSIRAQEIGEREKSGFRRAPIKCRRKVPRSVRFLTTISVSVAHLQLVVVYFCWRDFLVFGRPRARLGALESGDFHILELFGHPRTYNYSDPEPRESRSHRVLTADRPRFAAFPESRRNCTSLNF